MSDLGYVGIRAHGASGLTSSVADATVWRRLLAHRDGRAGIIIAAGLIIVAIVGPVLSLDPNLPNYRNELSPPSTSHWLGTDSDGRDLLARSLAGARSSLVAALLVTGIAVALGLLVGVTSGVIGGRLDAVLTRLTDVLLGLPGLVMTLAIVGVLGPGFLNLVLAMSLTGWAGMSRLARTVARSSAQRLDVVAARMAGIGELRIAVTHVLPSAAQQVLIAATMGLGEVVLALAGLSFLGLGAQPPTAEWGNMVSTSRETLSIAPWQLIGPGTGLLFTVLAATLISEAMRDVTSLELHR